MGLRLVWYPLKDRLTLAARVGHHRQLLAALPFFLEKKLFSFVNPLQYSCLGNPMDGGAWRATVPGIPKRGTQLNTHTCTQIAP